MTGMKNIWSIGLILFFVVFISGMVGFVVWSTHQREDLVAADYYDQEIGYQQRIEAGARAAAAGLKLSVRYDVVDAILRLTFAQPAALQASTGTVALYRPSDASLDRVFAFDPDSAGAQSIPAALAPGLWRVKLEWQQAGQTYYAEEAVVVP